jgi:isocitrate/isopropylmalate dehydrogenase
LLTRFFRCSLLDKSSVLSASRGLLPSSSLAGPSTFITSAEGVSRLYNLIDGFVLNIVVKGIANLIAKTLSTAMLLCHSLGLDTQVMVFKSTMRTISLC